MKNLILILALLVGSVTVAQSAHIPNKVSPTIVLKGDIMFGNDKKTRILVTCGFDTVLDVTRKNNYKFYELSYKWNHMTMFSEKWNKKADRFDSCIIHYAGGGRFERGVKDRLQQIKKDIKRAYG